MEILQLIPAVSTMLHSQEGKLTRQACFHCFPGCVSFGLRSNFPSEKALSLPIAFFKLLEDIYSDLF